MLQGEAQHHGGIAGRALDVLFALAAVDEDFAGRAVGIETDGDRERLVSEPHVEGLCGAALWKGSPDHGRALAGTGHDAPRFREMRSISGLPL